MTRASIYVATALLALPVLVAVVLFFRAPLDPHYGVFPKFAAATTAKSPTIRSRL